MIDHRNDLKNKLGPPLKLSTVTKLTYCDQNMKLLWKSKKVENAMPVLKGLYL